MISGKAINKGMDANGNIKVDLEFTLTDGSKKTGHTRYTFRNFTQEAIAKDIKRHCENLMSKAYMLKENLSIKDTIDVTKIKYDCTETTIVITPAVIGPDGTVTTPAETRVINDD